jgi:hypothetical protein
MGQGYAYQKTPDFSKIRVPRDRTRCYMLIGVGLDYFILPDISIGIEGDYVSGFGNVVDINYFNILKSV